MFEFFVQALPAKLKTLLVVKFCYISLVCYHTAPCYSDQGADLRQHVRGLDKYMADDVGNLSLKFFDLASIFLLNLLAVSGPTCAHVIS